MPGFETIRRLMGGFSQTNFGFFATHHRWAVVRQRIVISKTLKIRSNSEKNGRRSVEEPRSVLSEAGTGGVRISGCRRIGDSQTSPIRAWMPGSASGAGQHIGKLGRKKKQAYRRTAVFGNPSARATQPHDIVPVAQLLSVCLGLRS